MRGAHLTASVTAVVTKKREGRAMMRTEESKRRSSSLFRPCGAVRREAGEGGGGVGRTDLSELLEAREVRLCVAHARVSVLAWAARQTPVLGRGIRYRRRR
jgi:hypothetical protein